MCVGSRAPRRCCSTCEHVRLLRGSCPYEQDVSCVCPACPWPYVHGVLRVGRAPWVLGCARACVRGTGYEGKWLEKLSSLPF